MKKENVIFAVVNRNGKAIMMNSETRKYHVLDGANSQKASLKAICELMNSLGNASGASENTTTIMVPKNLGFILRKESVYEWINNGNKTKAGNELDEEFIELCKYISDMRNWFRANGVKVYIKMTQTPITTIEEEKAMKIAWDLLDKVTGYNSPKANRIPSRPNVPKFMSKEA